MQGCHHAESIRLSAGKSIILSVPPAESMILSALTESIILSVLPAESMILSALPARECPKLFTGVEEHCLEKSTWVGADYQYAMKNLFWIQFGLK
jgi:hypothetical protein